MKNTSQDKQRNYNCKGRKRSEKQSVVALGQSPVVMHDQDCFPGVGYKTDLS